MLYTLCLCLYSVVPSMTGQGRGKLEFLTRLRLRNDPELPKVKLVTGSVHVDKVFLIWSLCFP